MEDYEFIGLRRNLWWVFVNMLARFISVLCFSVFSEKDSIRSGVIWQRCLINKKVKFTFYYEVILDIWGYFHFYIV